MQLGILSRDDAELEATGLLTENASELAQDVEKVSVCLHLG